MFSEQIRLLGINFCDPWSRQLSTQDHHSNIPTRSRCGERKISNFELASLNVNIKVIVSSVRSSYSHPHLLLTHHHQPTHFFRSPRSSTLDFHFLRNYSYIKALMLYKGNHWTQCAGFMDASWVQLGINNDDLGTSWAQPGDNLGMIWG